MNQNIESGLSRKKFLQSSLWIGLSLSVTRCIPTKRIEGKFLILSDTNLETIEVFAKAILPTDPNMPSPSKAEIFQRLDEELYFIDPTITSDFRDALLLIEYYPIYYYGVWRWKVFSKLTTPDASQLINDSLQASNELVRAAFANVRMVLFLMYYGHESSWKEISYDGPFGGFPQKLSEQRRYYKEEVR